jgi:hypothetical protein
MNSSMASDIHALILATEGYSVLRSCCDPDPEALALLSATLHLQICVQRFFSFQPPPLRLAKRLSANRVGPGVFRPSDHPVRKNCETPLKLS